MRTAESIKEASEAHLKQLGLEINAMLPFVESPEETCPRSAVEVAQQLVAVSYMVRVGFGFPVALAREHLLKLGIFDVLGSTSKEILTQEQLSDQDKINLTWQVEGLQSLAWALSLVQLDHTRECDDDLSERGPAQSQEQEQAFIKNAKLRPISEIQEQVDLLYRMHWAAVNARFTRKSFSLNESVIRERRRALDWVYGTDPDWDEVPLDT